MGSTTSSSTKYKTAHLLGAVIIAFLVGVFLSWAANSALSSSEASLTSSEGGKSPSKPEDRVLISDMLLPTSAIPEKYDLWMKLYLPGYGATVTQSKNLTYDANVVISLEVKKTLKSITLNSVGHSFDKEGSFLEMEDDKMRIVEIIKQDKAEKVEFVLEKAVHKGDVKLHVKYSGAILTGLDGLYQTKYTSADGTPRIAAVTQMEPMDARKMVPCFDEPAHKAEWEVTIVHPKGTSALANGIELGEPKEIEEGFLETKFKETPKMSSYLLAIFVSEFKFVEKETSSGVRFRIWSRPEAIQTAEYALAAGVKCLEGFEKFYDYKYPLEKQDMVALPDFAAGAMENWGLITYREKDLLYDAEVYYYPEKMRVTQVIAHELAHQWFGNLVTMKWWDDIWLNEGFAAFVQNIGMDIIADGAFKMETDFVGNQQKQAMEMDATAASHPIVFPTTYKNEINELFDNISYRKGASLLSMIRRIMGEEDFNQGLKNYLKKYAYKNAEHGNLFHEWDQTVSVVGPNGRRMNVTDFALKWTRQMGYPYLTLERVNGTAVKVVQRRYKVDPNAKEIEKFSVAPYGYKWDVPVWIQRGENQKTELHWLPAHGDLLLPARKGESLLINADSYAIARTHYSNQEWRNIIRRLESNPETFSVRSRYRIVSDVFAMAEIGNVEYSLALELVNYIRKEKEFHVWQAFLLQIDTIRAYFGTSPEIVAVEDFMKVFITPVAKNVDVASAIAKMTDDTTYMQNRVDVLIFEQHCRVNPAECREIFATYRTTQFEALCGDHGVSSECSKVPSAVRSSVYCTSVKEGDDAFFKKMVGFYQRETMQLEKERLMKALGCTRNPVNVKWLLGNILDRNSSVFRTQDLGKVANHVAENPIGSEIVLGYLFSNWDSLEKNYGDANFVFKTLVKEFTSQVRDRYALNQLKTFMENTPGTKKYSAYRAQLQAAEQRIEWLEKNGAIVVKTFKEHTRKLEESV